MKQVIGGKLYNTRTATLVANYWNGHFYNDFHCVDIDLYRAKSGIFFLKEDGGAMTEFAVSHGNSWGGGTRLRVIDAEKAREFAERHATPEEYAQHFQLEDA